MPFTLDKNYYKILNIEPSATLSEVKKAFHKLAMETHPGEAFKRVYEAYEMLSDENQREKYDCFLAKSHKGPQQFAKNKQDTSKDKNAEDLLDEVIAFFKKQQQTRQEKEVQETKQRMSCLHLSKEQETKLWQIHQDFSHDENHFQHKNYSVETLKNLLYVFCDVSLSHLDEECQNNPDIVDMSFNHSFAGLRYASKEAIMLLFDRKESMLYKKLSYTKSHIWEASEFLQYYPYKVDTNLFIKLMLINPLLIKPLSQKEILEFLRDPQCHQHKEKLYVCLYTDNRFYTNKKNNAVGENLEILFEIYSQYDRNVLRKINFFDDLSQNHDIPRRLVKNLFTKYPNDIDLFDIISINRLVDHKSLCFRYNAVEESLTCTGKLFDEGDGKPCTFSKTHQIMARNASRLNCTFLDELAMSLEPKIFCKMLASIPTAKRTQYLFSGIGCASTYYTYLNKVKNTEHYHTDCFSWGKPDNKTKKEKTKEYFDALSQLIYPTKPMNTDDLIKIKQEVCSFLNHYTAWWKLSFFGHHHEVRAKQIIKTINKANSLAQIGLIIENQLALFENKATDSPFHKFTLEKIFDGESIDWRLQARWFNSSPKNVPLQKNLMGSGYYRALKLAKDVIAKHNQEEQLIEELNASSNNLGTI
ncbi:J domain-containing protein [Legionella sp.]|uniref:J domain-containing protein n=1 Tax=Legionella sp. TaxID=459 RepID=UPI003C883AE3